LRKSARLPRASVPAPSLHETLQALAIVGEQPGGFELPKSRGKHQRRGPERAASCSGVMQLEQPATRHMHVSAAASRHRLDVTRQLSAEPNPTIPVLPFRSSMSFSFCSFRTNMPV